jgi:hypothetical protein
MKVEGFFLFQMEVFIFISLLAQRNEAKKVHHERQPKAFLGAQAALLGSENFRFAPFVDTSPGFT